MTHQEKKNKIKQLATDMLIESHAAMIKQIDRALNSGAVDLDAWDTNSNPMILPKCIVVAILQSESAQYEAKGTSFEKQVKQEVKNLRNFI